MYTLAVGDVSNSPDPLCDELSVSPLVHSVSGGPTPFARLLVELGLMDVWPNTQTLNSFHTTLLFMEVYLELT